MSELRSIPIYRALSRPELIAGCEREPILTAGLMAATLIFVSATILSAMIGVLLWLVCFALFRKMVKADPHMSKLYVRHIKYKNYYPAKATPFAPSAEWKRGKKK